MVEKGFLKRNQSNINSTISKELANACKTRPVKLFILIIIL